MIFAEGEPPPQGEYKLYFLIVTGEGEHRWQIDMAPEMLTTLDKEQLWTRYLYSTILHAQQKLGLPRISR